MGSKIILTILVVSFFAVCLGQNHFIKLKIQINRKINLTVPDLPVYISYGINASRYFKGIFVNEDSTYIFQGGNVDSLRVPYSLIIVIFQGKEYSIPIDHHYQVTYTYPEFRNRKSLQLKIKNLKKISKFNGAFSYSICDGSANSSGLAIYYSSNSYVYKSIIDAIKQPQ